MLRSAASKAMWVGRTTAAVIGLVIALAIVFGVATMALAAVPGDPFKLGKVNSINRLSTLVGTATSPILKVQNKGTGTTLDLRVQQGKPPLTTNSTGRVSRLNADMVDGKHASAFLPAGGKATDSEMLDGKDSTDFYAAGSKVSDSGRLEGLPSTAFVRSRWAVINANGTPRRGKHIGIGLTRKLGTGHYQVDMISDVRTCSYVATTTDGFAGQTGVREGTAVYLVEVFTTDSAGTRADFPFHLVVAC